jgi:ubiquinone/menaquinone biosynthesis C-methylase UbiE
MTGKSNLVEYFNQLAPNRDKWRKRNRFYHRTIEKYYAFTIPEGSRVLEIGSGTGELLYAVKPSYGVGIDFSEEMVKIAEKKFPDLHFICANAENYEFRENFDYIILSDLLSSLQDIQEIFRKLRSAVNPHTKIIISSFSYLWEPLLRLGEFLRLKHKLPYQSWLTRRDIKNLLHLEEYETIKSERKLLFPKYIPVFNAIFNKFLGNMPFFNNFCLINFITARPLIKNEQEYSVSILVPARNEKGNIENAILRTPKFGSKQQFIFVEGNSSDNTYEEMLRVQKKYKDHDILVMKQSGKGKGNAVREGFDKATNDILMILDADLTTPPEDMTKFYNALKSDKGEFINGCRLVYPMEKQAMRFLNFLGNKFFGWFFSFLLGQRLKDTLCGTKVLFREDYIKIKNNRSYFGEFDPFGDFDLLFGAAKLNLKITEVIVRYRDREYGSTQISRFKHGWLLIKMSFFAAFKLKFK